MSKKPSPKIADVENSHSEEDSAGEMTWPQPDFDKQRAAAILKHPHFLRKKRFHSASFSNSGANGLTFDGVPSDVRALTAVLQRSHVSSTRTLYGKNSKKSRDGRRVPSKRGGKSQEDPTDVLDEIVLDHHDPDYDSDNEVDFHPFTHLLQDPVTFESLSPPLTDEEFERTFVSLMNEFFIHGKTEEVLVALTDLNLAAHQRRRLPYLAITMALQHKQTQCELTSELLSDLCGKVINQAHVQQGFALVLSELGELTIDFPKASEHVGRFIARAMADDILPPKFIEFQKLALSQFPTPVHCHGDAEPSPPTSAPPVSSHQTSDFNGMFPVAETSRSGTRNLSDGSNGLNGANSEQTVGTSVSSGIGSASSLAAPCMTKPEVAMAALVRAESLLTLSHAFARLDNIWGVPVGPRATRLLVKKVQGLLKAYMSSNDLDEATEALLELDSPHFHHELVFQASSMATTFGYHSFGQLEHAAVVMAIEMSTDDARTRIVRLLQELCRSVVVTPNQLALGIRRVYAELPDLQLDVPAAYLLMERFSKDAQIAGFMAKKLVAEMPTKPRKRFISETDSIYRSGHNTQLL
ncbi:programmed cell death protein 4 [Paragonimus westermani]|uniref:Programmed cell death protein 4 n=1 Tax=Paragonimus westermani TaxID=34504 RepID=A0A5J4P1N2_9TREM|nr:programmed cell death protein 4 [Paragonimus westermani]